MVVRITKIKLMKHSLLKAFKSSLLIGLVLAGILISSGVNARSSVTISISADTICAGDSLKVFATSSRVSGATYTWSIAVGPSGSLTSTNDTAVFKPTASTLYRVISDSAGFKDTALSLIQIHANQPVGLIISKDTVCMLDQITLKGSGALTYSYFKGSIASGGGDSVNVIITKNDSVSVIGTDANGCKMTAFKKVVAKELPTVSFKVYVQGFLSRNKDACATQDFTLKATSGYPAYNWSSTSQIVGSNTDSTIIGNTAIAANYAVIVTGDNGCSKAFNQLIRTTQQDVKGVTINLVGGNLDTVLCGGEVRRANANTGDFYKWSPASAIDSGSITSTKVRLKPAFDETIILTGIFAGCITRDTIILRVSQLPTLTFVSQTSSAAQPLCEGDGDTIRVSSNSSRILWNTVSSSRTTKTVAFKQTTTFDVIAFNALDCVTKITITSHVDTACGIKISTEEFEQQNLNAFYNSVNGKMILSTSTELVNASVVVYDLSGNEIFNNSVELVPNARMEFDFSSLSDGAYLFRLFNSDSDFTKKFIKH